ANFPSIPPSVTLTSPANGSVFAAPANITLTADAADTDGIVTNVAFYRNGTKLADVGAPPFYFNWKGAYGGNYSLTAVIADDEGLMATSSVVNITVTNSPAIQTLQQIKTVF